MSPEVLAVIGPVITAAIVAGGSVLVAKLANRSTRESNKEVTVLGWAEQLSKRLDKVESELEELREELAAERTITRTAAGYIDRLLWWFRTGRKGTMPWPPKNLQPHLDPNLLEEDTDEATA